MRKLIWIIMAVSCSVYADTPLIQGQGVAITVDMLAQELSAQEGDKLDILKGNSQELRRFIDILYREKIFEKIARERGLDKSINFQHRRAAMERRLLAYELVENQKAKLHAPDMAKRAREYYQANPGAFKMSEQAEARHILIKAKAEESPEQARQRAVTIRDRAIAGENFEVLAKQNSDDRGSADKGGSLGTFTRGKMVPAFEEAVFKLRQPGSISDIVETQFGWHVIQLVKYLPERQVPFDEIKDKLQAKLAEDYIDNEYNQWRDALTDPAKATIDHDRLETFIQKQINENPSSAVTGSH